MKTLKTLFVTRHKVLVDYLLEKEIINEGEFEVMTHATPQDVKGRHVVGVLPHSLSCLTSSFTEVVLNLPPEKRGKELTLDDMLTYSKGLNTYKVTRL